MGKTKSTNAAPRLAALDILRAFAVLLVLGRHMPELPVSSAPGPVLSFLRSWTFVGWVGVDFFFVLSGFLISGLLFREYERFGSIRYGHFLARRGFKIYPPFYFMMAVVLWYGASQGRQVGWPVIGSELLFIQNYGPALFPHTWSLAVEEHFYLLLPLLLLALLRKKRGAGEKPFAALPRIFALVAVAVLAARLLVPADEPLWLKAHVAATHLRLDSLLFGVVLSWGYHFHQEGLMNFVRRWRVALAFAAVLLFLPAFFIGLGAGWYLHTLGFTANYLTGGACLLLALHFQPNWPPLAFLGRYSYSIYLWHVPIRYFGLRWVPRDWPPSAVLVIYFLLCLAVGVLVAKLVETPFLALRDRLLPSRSSGGKAEFPAGEAQQAELFEEPTPVASR